MGRKIPKSKRHKKLKFVDPAFRGRLPKTKNYKKLPNEPPPHEDCQDVPRHVEQIMNIKNHKVKRKKKKMNKNPSELITVQRDMIEDYEPGRPLKKGPDVMKQETNESQYQFINRLQHMADIAVAEAKVEAKYNINVVNIDEKGNAHYERVKNVTKKNKEKRKKIIEKEREKKNSKIQEKELDFKKESIRFGEVVMAPPTFTAKPRKAPQLDKAGKRKLQLNKLLSPKEEYSIRKPTPLATKWRNMTDEKRKSIENERLRVIEMYRRLKNKK